MTPVRRNAAFTLAEMLISTLLLGLLLVVLFALFTAVQRATIPATAIINDQAISVAPTYAPFPDAVQLNQILSDRVGEARAVYVFGGKHQGLGTTPVVASQLPLGFVSLPTISPTSLPTDSRSLFLTNSTALGGVRTGATDEDFSIIVIGLRGSSAQVICAVQVSQIAVEIDISRGDKRFIQRTVKLWDIDSAQTYSYTFLERAGQGVFVGAVHTWHRYLEVSGIYEEGPATVSLPDPWVFAGSRGQADDIPAFSRFVYSLPISP